ncbi:MAG: histidinol dehydrogenase [Eubacteriales bacterium]|nr:histidinol dehydrogenase [Eubacteriales bacterium]
MTGENSGLIRVIRAGSGELQTLSEKLGMRGKMDLTDIITSVETILKRVRQDGDEAVLHWTRTFDRVSLTADRLLVSEQEISRAVDSLDIELLSTLRQAAEQIRTFHDAQRSSSTRLETRGGSTIELVSRPLDTVGVYVPGGTAPLPSSVLMNVLPARSAGVRRVIMCTPPDSDGKVNAAILAAASIAGVDAIYRIGGAQAIAAMAYGTAVVPRVDKIVGPGNIYVNTAKRMVYGQVDIDMFAGPSEILVIADRLANPAYVAADLLSQAEHDVLASAVLVTDSAELAASVVGELEHRVPLLPRAEMIRQSLAAYGAIVIVSDLNEAVAFANELAPEHLELLTEDPDDLLPRIQNAGAVFVGPYSPEPLGDYWAGPNHVLPTSGTARFFSPLNTGDFSKKMSVIRYTRSDLAEAWPAIARLAEAESLQAHADSARVRFGRDLSGRTM